jgi:hypothetical protein
MSELFFMLKCFGLAVLLVYLMQFKAGSQSIDDHMMEFAERSSVAGFLNDSGEGGARLIRQGYMNAKSWAHRQYSSFSRSESINSLPVKEDRARPKRYLDQPTEEETLEY